LSLLAHLESPETGCAKESQQSSASLHESYKAIKHSTDVISLIALASLDLMCPRLELGCIKNGHYRVAQYLGKGFFHINQVSSASVCQKYPDFLDDHGRAKETAQKPEYLGMSR
jgi:hypothetical protein